MNAVELSDVTFGYGREPVIRGVSFAVPSGEFWGVIGPNGSGKSTLLRLICGLHRPWAGSVDICRRAVLKIPARERARQIAFVPQESQFLFDFTVREIVLMGRFPHLHPHRTERAEDLDIVREVMEWTQTSELAGRRVTEISGGERQRVVLARALAQRPGILLLDEPTTHLDIRHQAHILGILGHLHRRGGLTVLAVFHDLNTAAEGCEALLLLSQGRVAAIGTPAQVLEPGVLERAYGVRPLIDNNPMTGKPRVWAPPEKP